MSTTECKIKSVEYKEKYVIHFLEAGDISIHLAQLGYGFTDPSNVDVFYGKSKDSAIMNMVALIGTLPTKVSLAPRFDVDAKSKSFIVFKNMDSAYDWTL